MKQINKDMLCYYCIGCIREEEETFAGVRNCKEFVEVVENWQELLRKEMLNEKKRKNRIIQ